MNPLMILGLPSPIILGSASFTRKLILKEMNIDYRICVRPIDEKQTGNRLRDDPSDLVLMLARAKMNHLVNEIKAGNCPEVANYNDEMVVLTGDQVVTWQGQILEKPESVQEARDMVAGYASSPPATVGSCVLTHLPSQIQVSGVDTATIHFHSSLSDSLVDELLEDDAPIMSCAGGLMIEHPKVKQHLDRIDGTEDSVMGLSKDLVLQLLNNLANKLKEHNVSK